MSGRDDVKLGVHSEVGRLRKAIVSRPSQAHERLTPANCAEMLFDDPIWVEKACADHAELVQAMEGRGVAVHDLQDLLAQAVDQAPGARGFVLDRMITAHAVGPCVARALRPWLDALDGAALARRLLGGIVVADVPRAELPALLRSELPGDAFLTPALPNAMFQRDPSSWVYGGVIFNQMRMPVRRPETLLQRAVCRFHPMFVQAEFETWWGDADDDFQNARIEGGDVMPLGAGVVRSFAIRCARTGGAASTRAGTRAPSSRRADRP